jgi:hypothetical protein
VKQVNRVYKERRGIKVTMVQQVIQVFLENREKGVNRVYKERRERKERLD